jgi:hypothetical protein
VPLDAFDKPVQRGLVQGVARQHLVSQRQTSARHHQRYDDLHTIRPVIAWISEAALVAFGKRRIGFEIGACQIVEQHVGADVEQITPPRRQMIDRRHACFWESLISPYNVTLYIPSGAQPNVCDNAPVAMLLFVLPENFRAQEHDGRNLSAPPRP